MRQPILLSAMLILLAATAPALAQVYPSQAVLQQDVEVRSGPSKTFFATSRLMRGDRIMVLRECKESPGWLEIKPPPGSFSWINGKYVKLVDVRYGVVDADPARPVPVMPGSTLVNQEPNRECIKLTVGTIVIIYDRPLSIGSDTWMPVLPHPSEVRYIPAESVKAATTVAPPATASNWTLTPKNNPNPNPTVQPVSVQKPAVSAYTPPNVAAPTAADKTIITEGPAWSKYGRLRDTGLKREDGQPIFIIEDPQGRPLAYVTTNPDKSLREYLGKIVAVYGPKVYRTDSAVRLEYFVASHTATP
jgi:hypothetical protein